MTQITKYGHNNLCKCQQKKIAWVTKIISTALGLCKLCKIFYLKKRVIKNYRFVFNDVFKRV